MPAQPAQPFSSSRLLLLHHYCKGWNKLNCIFRSPVQHLKLECKWSSTIYLLNLIFQIRNYHPSMKSNVSIYLFSTVGLVSCLEHISLELSAKLKFQTLKISTKCQSFDTIRIIPHQPAITLNLELSKSLLNAIE